MRSKAAQGLPGGLINTSLFLLRGCVWNQGEKKKKRILPVGSGGGDTVKHDASIFVRVFLVGGWGGGASSRQAPGFEKMSCDW